MTSFSGTFQIPRYTEKWFILKKKQKSLYAFNTPQSTLRTMVFKVHFDKEMPGYIRLLYE